MTLRFEHNLFSFERSEMISLELFFENWILKQTCSFCYVAFQFDFIMLRKSVTKYKQDNYIKPIFYEVKLIRAYSECLGTRRRRRTRLPAKSDGELEVSFDPSISEWGNPARFISCHLARNLYSQ